MTKEEVGRNDVEISTISKFELDQVAEVFMASFVNADPPETWTKQTSLEYVQYWFKRQPDLFLVARLPEKGNKIIGGMMAAIKPRPDGKHFTDTEIFVHPEHQNLNTAKTLTKTLLELAIDKYQVVKFEGIAAQKNIRLIKFYERYGLASTGFMEMDGNPLIVLEKLNTKS